MKNKNQKGSILYFAVLLLGILFSAGITVTTVLIQRIGMIEEMSYSTAAFYAADAGIEKVLYRWSDIEKDDDVFEGWSEEDSTTENFDDDYLVDGQEYYLRKDITQNDDGDDILVVVAIGSFSPSEDAGTIRRGIQVSREYEID